MGSNLMLVDDDHAALAMLRVAVRVHRLGRVVAEADSSAEANRLAALKRPDVIVLDLFLTDAVGRTVFEGVRRAAPDSRVVIYSAYESRRRWYEKQGVTFVGKSLSTDELVAALRTV